MQSSMFSGLFGALTAEMRLNNISNNLANVNTTGYKQDNLAFRDTFVMYAHDQIMEPTFSVRSKKLFPDPDHKARVRPAVAQTDFSQGSMKVTGSKLDVAISGKGFFKIQTPQGEYYSRNGHFNLSAEGIIVTDQGFPVLGDGGPVTIPAGTKDIVIAEDGRVYADEAMVGQIGVVAVDDEGGLEKLGNNMYRPRNGREVAEVESDAVLAQGFVETANVNVVYEMVNMIEAQRQFEAYQKIMQTSDTIDKTAVEKVGRNR